MHAPNSVSSNVKSPTLHALTIFTLLVFITILVLSFVLHVEIVARGAGRVIPDGRVQIVQAEFGGKVEAINVRNGSQVHAGDILFELDKTEAIRDVSDIKSEQSRLLVERVRLAALRYIFDPEIDADRALDYYDELSKADGLNAKIVTEHYTLLQSELLEFHDVSAQYSARIQSAYSAIAVAEARTERLQNAVQIENERHEVAKKLFDGGNSSRTTYLNALQNLNELNDQLNISGKELEQRNTDWQSAKQELKTLRSSRLNEIERRNNEILERLSVLDRLFAVAERRLENLSVRAPVNGTIDKLEVFTIGAVLADRQEVLSIVPSNSQPIIEVMFSNVDVGFLETGQKANIKLDAFPSERFGLVDGKLVRISADSVELSANQWGFVAQILPNEPFLSAGTEKYQLKPGMTATVDVITGERNLISYFFAPILRTIGDSLGER